MTQDCTPFGRLTRLLESRFPDRRWSDQSLDADLFDAPIGLAAWEFLFVIADLETEFRTSLAATELERPQVRTLRGLLELTAVSEDASI